jgi:tRNA (guanine-N7-)-methyltransferase
LGRVRRLPLEELAAYLLAVPETRGVLAWPRIFGNDNPVEIEVGFGKGLFLVTASQVRPDVNFLGIEIARKYQLFTATRLAKRNLRNVLLARADARAFFRDYVAAESCQAVHVYFPDPWWKKRHLKRRVFTPEFAEQCERILKPGGYLYIVTDVGEYFDVITGILTQRTSLRRLMEHETSLPAGEVDYLTNFERKFRLQGRPIYRATYQRNDF